MSGVNDETRKLESDFELERYKANAASNLELLRATIAFEHAALRPLPLLNGGAIIAVLTFAGHAVGTISTPPFDQQQLKVALISWFIGLLLSVLATFAGYQSQFNFLNAGRRQLEAQEAERSDNREKAGRERCRYDRFSQKANRARRVAFCVTFLSLLAFIIGSGFALSALNFPHSAP